MATEWAFLEPWYAALCASFIQHHPKNSKSEMKVSFKWPYIRACPYHRECFLMVHLKEGDPQNVIQLKMIREAMELFTILSVVNDKACTERFSKLTQSTDDSERRYYPGWNLYVIGDVAVQQDTWSSFIEFSDPSPQFQRAIQTLKAKGLGDTDKGDIFFCSGVQWKCKFDGANVRAHLLHDEETDTLNGIQIDLRAMFNAWFKEDSVVEVVIPGFGRCQSRIGDGVCEVSRDSEGQSAQVSGTLRTLKMTFITIEAVSLVVNLLGLIGRNLRLLTLGISSRSNDLPLDLSVLSALCPNLEFLNMTCFNVVVSIHNEALRLWPIKWLTIKAGLADITKCLRNPSLRMARELEELYIKFCDQECDEQEKRDLMTHNGDFLAVTKQKFPIQSKAALISVVDGAHCAKAIPRLHEDVVGLIFAFASMPAQRSVHIWSTQR